MSKAIKSVASNVLNPAMEMWGGPVDFSADNNLINYYSKLDTSMKDKSNDLMAQEGYNLAQTLSSRPDYVYSVDGSDGARQRAENATYQSYMDRLTPQFQQQTNDLETRLANQGLAVGSAAYNRAMTNLYDSQNSATNQAAYQSVLNGQNAYTQSLQDAINAANFSNSARSGALNEINTSLQNTLSDYERQLKIYELQKGIANQQTAQWQQGLNNMLNTVNTFGKVML